jgi:O-methyltransferase
MDLKRLLQSDDLSSQLRQLILRSPAPAARWSPLAFALREFLGLSGREEVLNAALIHQVRNKLYGDYLEFGLCSGSSFLQAYFYNLWLQERLRGGGFLPNLRGVPVYLDVLSRTRFLGFDSFEGMPAPTELDHGSYVEAELAVSYEEFQKILRENSVDLTRVRLVKGFFDQTLTAQTRHSLDLKAAAVVHIDSDFYESARRALDFVQDSLIDGAVIIFDDWFLYNGDPTKGEQRAFSEWRARNPDIGASEFMCSGFSKAFVIHRGNGLRRG